MPSSETDETAPGRVPPERGDAHGSGALVAGRPACIPVRDAPDGWWAILAPDADACSGPPPPKAIRANPRAAA